jgi:FkbM family methyltransferase
MVIVVVQRVSIKSWITESWIGTMDLGTARRETAGKEFPQPSENRQLKVLFSLKNEMPEDPRLVNFHQLEHYSGVSFRWSEPVSMIRIKMPPANARVVLDTACLRGESLDFPFQLHWNDYQVPAKVMTIQHGELSFDVGPRVCEPTGEQRLTISCKPLNAENGRRKLGLPVSTVQIFELGQTASESVLSFEKYSPPKHSKWLNSARALLRRKVTPSIPIWQVRIPDANYGQGLKTETRGNHSSFPACNQVVVAPCEINSRHGTGLLIQYLMEDFDQLATVNSYHCYNGDRVASRVHHCLPDYKGMSRQDIYDQMVIWFGKCPPAEAYVVPYFSSDFVIASALKDLFKTKICLHVMDDNCLYGSVPEDVVQEAIDKCDLLLTISPEMRQRYEQWFGKKAFMLPPIVPQQFIPQQLVDCPTSPAINEKQSHRPFWKKVFSRWRKKPAAQAESQARGILIGNVWDSAWLEMLRQTVRSSGLQIDWFANNPNAVWHDVSKEQLLADGIHLHDSLWGNDLIAELRKRPYAIMPTGALGGEGTKESIARLSLPSRVPFMMATAHLPMIVLGSAETAAARFLQRFDLGTSAEYDGTSFRAAVSELLQPQRQAAIRARAHDLASKFSSSGLQRWMWESLRSGRPIDARFDDLFDPQPGEFTHYFDAEPPGTIHWSIRETWKLIHRVGLQGFKPDVVIDVGASTGVWSWTASTVFPNANYVLVDPLMRRYDESTRQQYLSGIKSQQFLEVAVSDHCGQMEMRVSGDLYSSSLLPVKEKVSAEEVANVEAVTLEELARRCRISGRVLLKIDAQFAEHLVISGGLEFIRKHVDVMILELTLHRAHGQAKTYLEMLAMMDQLGYEVIDEREGWRDPKTGILKQKDTVFVRKERRPMLRAA